MPTLADVLETAREKGDDRRRLRLRVSINDRDQTGRTSLGLGLRVGWWPCLKAPYIQVAAFWWRIDLWHGLPSYKYQRSKP